MVARAVIILREKGVAITAIPLMLPASRQFARVPEGKPWLSNPPSKRVLNVAPPNENFTLLQMMLWHSLYSLVSCSLQEVKSYCENNSCHVPRSSLRLCSECMQHCLHHEVQVLLNASCSSLQGRNNQTDDSFAFVLLDN